MSSEEVAFLRDQGMNSAPTWTCPGGGKLYFAFRFFASLDLQNAMISEGFVTVYISKL
jgi:hypothetical protein